MDAVSFDHGNKCHILFRAGADDAIHHVQLYVAALSHERTDAVNRFYQRGAVRKVHMVGEIIGGERRMLHSRSEGCASFRDLIIETVFSIFSDQDALTDNRFHVEGAGLVDEKDVCILPRCDGAHMVIDLVRFGGVDGAHLDSSHRCHAGLDGQAHDMVDVAVRKDPAGVHVIGAEAGMASHAGAALGDGADIFLQEFRDRRLTDDGVHAFSGFFQEFLVVVAFVIHANAAHEVFIQLFAGSQRAAAKDRAVLIGGFYDGIERILVLRLHRFADQFPNAVATGIAVIFRMVFGRDIVSDGGFRNGIRGFVRQRPEDFQRRCVDFLENIFQAVHTNDRNIFIQPADDTGGAARNHGFGEAGHAHLAAFHMDMAVDKARRQVFAGSVDDFCVSIDVVGNIRFHRGDAAFVNGHIGLVIFAGIDVNQRAAANGQVSLHLSRAGIDIFRKKFSSKHSVSLISGV